ncbi:MAG TPA: hypothetical protein VHU84_02070 [Lacipirellulaceae bacterium]|jgi:hypothetical protein|nr:hypothetical protein [Lacipirellulaceae bacterium]
MSELLQEFVDSGSQRLRVDREAGVIRGVKLLGLNSRNGRRYRESALVDAIALYEGAKVNINHPKGHPLSPRDYQDRLGVVRGVQFRASDGLFGDLHFNPRHALSEQLVWDAEHASQNVGMSHNVLARTKQVGDEVVVEAITKVQSIDLVADPATTSGLYEHDSVAAAGSAAESATGERAPTEGWSVTALENVTLEDLRRQRPELVSAIEQPYESQLAHIRQNLDELLAKEEVARRHTQVMYLLQEYDLPIPTTQGSCEQGIVSNEFLQALMQAPTDDKLRSLVEERAALVRSVSQWRPSRAGIDRRPKSKDQLAIGIGRTASQVRSAADFAAAVRGG